MRFILFILLVFCCTLPCRAQLLIDVGYSPSYYELEAMDQLETKFNSERPWLETELNSFRIFHGVHARIKHRFKNWGPWIEMNYQVSSNKFAGTEPGATNDSKGKIKSNYTSYLAGFEAEKDWFGIGTGFGQQTLKYRFRQTTGNSDIDDRILNSNSYMLTVFINLLPTIRESNLANLVIQPYYNHPLGNMEFDSLSNYFGYNNFDSEQFWQVGIRLILSNGQRF